MSAALSSIPPPMPGLAHEDLALTVVLFKPDGGRAKTLRLRAWHLLVAAVVVTGTALAALACGWVIGEWTARL
jgi:hypothetical protein